MINDSEFLFDYKKHLSLWSLFDLLIIFAISYKLSSN